MIRSSYKIDISKFVLYATRWMMTPLNYSWTYWGKTKKVLRVMIVLFGRRAVSSMEK